MLKSLKANKINVDRRGKITTGTKIYSEKAGRDIPHATDYFNIDSFPELKEVYGEKPSKLMIIFPTDEIADFFAADNVLYGSNNAMIRKCDGEECTHRIDEELTLVGRYNEAGELEETPEHQKKYVAGEIGECVCKLMPATINGQRGEKKNPKLCSCAMYLKAFVVDHKKGKIIQPTCYHFYSGSENSAMNIYSELMKIFKLMNGRIAGLPFGLSVDMVPGRTRANIKYPIWNIQALGTMAQLEKAAESFLFDYREITQGKSDRALPEKTETENKPNENIAVDDPEPDDLVSPDYFIEKAKSFDSLTDLDAFEKQHQLDINFFDINDKARVQTAFSNRRKELKNK